MVFPSNANIAVTDISVDEANDELDFAIRGVFHRLMLRFVPKERPFGRVLQK